MKQYLIEILNDCTKEELKEIYNKRWSDKGLKLEKQDYIDHIIRTYNQIESYQELEFITQIKKEQYKKTCNTIQCIIEEHLHLNKLKEYALLQSELMQRSKLENKIWIEKHAEKFNFIVKIQGVFHLEEIEKQLYMKGE